MTSHEAIVILSMLTVAGLALYPVFAIYARMPEEIIAMRQERDEMARKYWEAQTELDRLRDGEQEESGDA